MNLKKVCIVVAMMFSVSGFAQEMTNSSSTNKWVGISTGYPVGGVLHFGLNDFWKDADLRLNLAAAGTGIGSELFSAVSIYGGADLLFNLKELTKDVNLYAGGGLMVGMLISDVANAFGMNVRGLGGINWRAMDQVSVYLEPQLAMGGAFDSLAFDIQATLGANYHF